MGSIAASKLVAVQRVFSDPVVGAVLLVLAGLVVMFTDAQGLVAVLVVLAASGVSHRSGQLAGSVVAAAAGLVFLVVVWEKGATGVGFVLTMGAVLLWTLIAWAAGVSGSERRRVDEQLAEQVDELHRLAVHDPLTGLPNRVLLVDRLGHALQRAERHHSQVAVLLLDLDNFKLINDSLGHAAGDQLLVQVAGRLSAQLRGTDTAARFGGDEFVLVCEDLLDADQVVGVADRIIASLRPPFVIDGRDVSVTASIGIAVPGSATQSPDHLLQDADQAMYRAKHAGGGRFALFDEALRTRAVHRLDIEIALRQALERGELRLVYQPIVDLAENRVSGVEALLRWQHPTRGLLVPEEFLPVAESSSLIVDIGTWVLDQACEQATRWSVTGWPLTMAINVSLRQLVCGSFDATLARAVSRSGVDPFDIQLEITETTLLQATGSMKSQLTRFSERGVSVGLDDFGTGYSSLSLINQFPVRFLKIDRSFTSGLGQDPGCTAITSAVVDLGRHLSLRTIAEGIETPAQLSSLRQLGCRYGQGYHLARPQPAGHVQQLLDRAPTWHPGAL